MYSSMYRTNRIYVCRIAIPCRLFPQEFERVFRTHFRLFHSLSLFGLWSFGISATFPPLLLILCLWLTAWSSVKRERESKSRVSTFFRRTIGLYYKDLCISLKATSLFIFSPGSFSLNKNLNGCPENPINFTFKQQSPHIHNINKCKIAL
jgi:hypothetical protein